MSKTLMATLLTLLATSTLPVILLIIYLFNRPDKFEHWMKIFYEILYSITSSLPRIKKHIDKKLVAASIQDTVNQTCDQINNESPGVLPHALKIEWVKSDTSDAFISKGKAVVRLKHYPNQDRNIVESTMLYLKRGFLPRSKHYLDQTLRQGCEYRIASRIFVSRRDTGAHDYFFETEMMPAISASKVLGQDLRALENLDSVGIFTRVFLTEVAVTGQKLLGTAPTDTVRRELRDFARFLEAIATKGKDEYVPLQFRGTKVRSAVILVAKRSRIEMYGINPYVTRVRSRVREGNDSIYIAAWGDEFVKSVLAIKAEIETETVDVIRRYDYPVHGTTKAILLVCQPRSSYLALQKRLQDEVLEAFSEIVPEVKNGSIKIVSVARREKVGFKVAVKSETPEVPDPKGCCIGLGAERIKQIKARFPQEFAGITLWSENIKEFILSAISLLNPKYVDAILLDEENLMATVRVFTQDSLAKAIGKAGQNIKLASELTGWLVNVELSPQVQKYDSPEQELRNILRREIGEILNGDIEIVNCARIKGAGSKVIVKWNSSKPAPILRASEVCFRQESLGKIRDRLGGEWVNFHEWHESPEEQIAACLYPIRRRQIKSVEIDDDSGLAVVTLMEAPEKITESQADMNLALCEEVTGYKIEVLYQ